MINLLKKRREGFSPVTRRKAAFVVEFKIAGSIRELEAKAQEAIQQIKDRMYIKELYDNGYFPTASPQSPPPPPTRHSPPLPETACCDPSALPFGQTMKCGALH